MCTHLFTMFVFTARTASSHFCLSASATYCVSLRTLRSTSRTIFRHIPQFQSAARFDVLPKDHGHHFTRQTNTHFDSIPDGPPTEPSFSTRDHLRRSSIRHDDQPAFRVQCMLSALLPLLFSVVMFTSNPITVFAIVGPRQSRSLLSTAASEAAAAATRKLISDKSHVIHSNAVLPETSMNIHYCDRRAPRILSHDNSLH